MAGVPGTRRKAGPPGTPPEPAARTPRTFVTPLRGKADAPTRTADVAIRLRMVPPLARNPSRPEEGARRPLRRVRPTARVQGPLRVHRLLAVVPRVPHRPGPRLGRPGLLVWMLSALLRHGGARPVPLPGRTARRQHHLLLGDAHVRTQRPYHPRPDQRRPPAPRMALGTAHVDRRNRQGPPGLREHVLPRRQAVPDGPRRSLLPTRGVGWWRAGPVPAHREAEADTEVGEPRARHGSRTQAPVPAAQRPRVLAEGRPQLVGVRPLPPRVQGPQRPRVAPRVRGPARPPRLVGGQGQDLPA